MPSTMYRILKYIEEKVPDIPITEHFNCSNCLEYKNKKNEECEFCRKKDSNIFFCNFPVVIKLKVYSKKLIGSYKDNKPQDKSKIYDVCDGSEYL